MSEHRRSNNALGWMIRILVAFGLCAGLAFLVRYPFVLWQESRAAEQSANHLREIAIALHDYEADHQCFPPVALTNAQGQMLLSWRVALLPYLGHQQLYDQFKLDEFWDSPHNRRLLEKMPEVYKRPGADAQPGMTFFRGFTGKGTMWEANVKLGFFSILDGSSNTVLIAEAADAVPWTSPQELPYLPNSPPPRLGGHSRNGFLLLFCDGHVHRADYTMDEQLLRRCILRADGMPIDLTPVR